MFTVDNSAPDLNILDTSYSEVPEDHKSLNFIPKQWAICCSE
jgi:hypothetical protein